MSNLVKCKTCQKDVSINAPTCIHCGEPLLVHEVTPVGCANSSVYMLGIIFIAGLFFFISPKLLSPIFKDFLGMSALNALSLSFITGAVFSVWLATFLLGKLAMGSKKNSKSNL